VTQPLTATAGTSRRHRSQLPAGLLAGAGILAQICYPLLDGPALRAATMLAVGLLCAAAVVHAGVALGRRAAGTLLAVAGGLGLAVEAVGVRTGFPFGEYAYTSSLGPALLGVPLAVPLAWTMLAYPCLLLGRRLAPAGGWRPYAVALLGGWTLAAWDLYLEPQMVAAGHWVWANPHPGLPGVRGIPLTNYAGWLAVTVLMVGLLDLTLPRGERPGEGVPAAVLGWTWLGSALGNAVFFDRPWIAVYGGLAMGLTVLPYLARRPAR
jgi:uncharacterized membrane protein